MTFICSKAGSTDNQLVCCTATEHQSWPELNHTVVESSACCLCWSPSLLAASIHLLLRIPPSCWGCLSSSGHSLLHCWRRLPSPSPPGGGLVRAPFSSCRYSSPWLLPVFLPFFIISSFRSCCLLARSLLLVVLFHNVVLESGDLVRSGVCVCVRQQALAELKIYL